MPQLIRPDAVLHYEVAGNAAPVLLIQGVGVLGRGWQPQVADLANDHQTLVFDNRDIGRSRCTGPVSIESMAGDSLALMDAMGWRSAHVVGHSMGGVVAQQLALDAPERVRSLSLLCTFARGKDGARPTPWVLWMTLRTRLGTKAVRRRAFLEMLYPAAFLAAADQDTLAAETGSTIGRDLADQPPVIMKQVRALGRHDASASLHRLGPIPTMVISGRHDPIARPEFGRRLAALIPRAVFEEMPDASHGLTLQVPDRINRRLREHFTAVEISLGNRASG